MQILNKSTIDFITRYTLAKVFGIKHELCANQFAPPMLRNCVFSIPLTFGGATLVALKQTNGSNIIRMEL